MGKLLEDSKNTLTENNKFIEQVLSDASKFINTYENKYLLNEIRDQDLIKQKMKDKIQMGIKCYDPK